MNYRDRALEGLIEAERELRENAERTAREYRALVLELAQRLAGEALEARRVENPGIPQVWTPADWRAFWWSVAIHPVSGKSAWTGGNGNGNGNGNGQVKALESEISRLKSEVEALRSALERTKVELAQERKAKEALLELSRVEEKAEKKQKAQESKAEKEQSKAKHVISKDMLSEYHRNLVEELREFVIPSAPLKFKEQLNPDEALRYKRKVLILYLVAVKGICSRLEIDRVMSALENVSARTNSIRKPADELVKSGLLVAGTLRMESPIVTGLAVYRLSEDGKALCQAWGWQVVENEWERLIRLHQGESQEAHTVAILAFALHARLRGWNVSILPEVAGKADPDVAVEKDGERWYVEVERGDGSRRKWKNLAGLNSGRVALCAADPAGRDRLVRDCKAERLNGVATDLRTLIFDGDSPRNLVDISPAEPLWLENW